MDRNNFEQLWPRSNWRCLMNNLAKKYNIYIEYYTLDAILKFNINILPVNFLYVDEDLKKEYRKLKKEYQSNIEPLDVIKLFENLYGY